MWLGEQVTERGIGNGISLIIFSGIVVSIPAGLSQLMDMVRTDEFTRLEVILLFGLIVGVVGAVHGCLRAAAAWWLSTRLAAPCCLRYVACVSRLRTAACTRVTLAEARSSISPTACTASRSVGWSESDDDAHLSGNEEEMRERMLRREEQRELAAVTARAATIVSRRLRKVKSNF